ncbi:MAG TPA: hypothetical protein DCZ10_12850 [Pelotomaculum sp.]|nr:hypothetical protein [Pelotomaculum sp.]
MPDKSTPHPFRINKEKLMLTGRVILGEWVEKDLNDLSDSISMLAGLTGNIPIQRGRVIVIRQTDQERLFSAFKSSLYHSKYNDMCNINRFLSKIVPSHHSYEPIRGENILFLFIGVGKPVYDNLITFSVGRPTRIAGGLRHSLPWGIEVPVETEDREAYLVRNMQRVRKVINLTSKWNQEPEVKKELEIARSELPVGYIMPPFIFEFSEETLVKNVFKQRLWEQGAHERTTFDIVKDMWDCCLALDEEKFNILSDYHGPQTVAWEKAMRTLRDKNLTLKELLNLDNSFYSEREDTNITVDGSINVYDLLMSTLGSLP